MNELALRIREHIRSCPLVNTHSHHLPDALLKGADLRFLLTNSYTNWLAPPPDFIDRDACEAYINTYRCNTYFRWLFEALESLYGIPFTADNLPPLDEAVRAAYRDPTHHLRLLTDNCRFETIVNERQPDPGSDLGHPELFSPSFRCDSYFSGYLKDKPDPNGFFAWSTFEKTDIPTLAEYLNEMKKAIKNKKAAGSKALKCAIAYERPLDFDEYNPKKAEKALNNPDARADEINAFGNTVMRALCEAAAEYGLPLQIHTGMGQLKNTNPIRLLTLIEDHPDTKFHLLHGGFPWLGDTYALLHNFRNVWSDTCWIPYLSTRAATEYIQTALEVSDASRLTWGCDAWMSEDSCGALLAMEHTLALTLSEMVEDGAFDIEYAMMLADGILYGNGKKLFGL